MAKTNEVKHYVHFLVNGCAGFVEVMGDDSMWVRFDGGRMDYSCMQGKLKLTVHCVMVQYSLISSWRG
ncbi:hypothetical protein PGN80_13130 [Klebsiella aerogenes]|uniref:hypothetical protein n=1 Tax=Klebsiella aerogenes TaxID=548 RepID=UPI00301BFBD5